MRESGENIQLISHHRRPQGRRRRGTKSGKRIKEERQKEREMADIREQFKSVKTSAGRDGATPKLQVVR